MSDIYSSSVANEVLVLENDREFCNEMEKYASQITPSFYRLKKISDRRNKDLVVAFSQGEGFLSYSMAEMYNAKVSDLVSAALSRNNLSCIVESEKRGIINSHFIGFYTDEIKLGNSFISSRILSVLNARNSGASKAQIARDHDITVYQVNKHFDFFPKDAYNRYLEVLNRKPYHEVMKEALNAEDPLTPQEVRERRKEVNKIIVD